jgi:hypothetical protein
MIGLEMRKFLMFAVAAQLLPVAQQASAEPKESGEADADKKPANEKKSVVFKNGDSVDERAITEELEKIPEQISSRMSLADIKLFLMVKSAYMRVMSNVAEASGIGERSDVRDAVSQKRMTVAGLLLQDAKAEEMMTHDALRAHYDDVWEGNFKGTKDFTITTIAVDSESVLKKVKMEVHDEKSMKTFSESNPSVKFTDIGTKPQAVFPQEVSSAILAGGEHSVVGPFDVNGSRILLYVREIKDAKKEDFSEDFEARYRQIAKRDFANRYMKGLYKEYSVKVFDVDGSEVDAFEVIAKKGSDVDKKKKSSKRPTDLSKIGDDLVLARLSEGRTVTVGTVKKFFKVDSLLDESFLTMAQQFGIKLEEVLVYATKLVVDDMILACEVRKLKYDEEPRVRDRLDEISKIEILSAYYKENIRVGNEDVTAAFNRTLRSIPEEEKSGNEISVKMVFFPNREDASVAMKSILSGESKFNDMFKKRSSGQERSAVDLGYIKKSGTPPEFWGMIQKAASGTCCRDILNTSGEQYGARGKDYAIVYVADKRPIALPSLSNPRDKAYFQSMAELEKRLEHVKAKLKEEVKSIGGKPIDAMLAESRVQQTLASLIGTAAR